MSSPNRVPKYRLHKGTGYAFVQHRTIRNKSHRLYLGKYGTPESLRRYQQFLQRLQVGAGEPLPALSDCPTIDEVIIAYLDFARSYYSRDGKLSSQYASMKRALKILGAMFGEELASSFGPKSLRMFQLELVKVDCARSYINQVTDRVKRFFRWACAEELVPPSVYQALDCVPGLRRGDLGSRDNAAVRPVDLATVHALLPFVSPTLAALLQVQYLGGMRPREACTMRPCDIDMTGDIWLYRPASHKNAWRGRGLIKALPRAAQLILAPFIAAKPADAFLFDPQDATAWARHERIANRKPRTTKRYPSEERRVERMKRLRLTNITESRCYSKDSYLQAIHHGIEKAAATGVTIPHFSPNQLRHAIVSHISRTIGAQAAQRYAGHASLSTTSIYTEIDVAEIIAIAKRLDDDQNTMAS